MKEPSLNMEQLEGLLLELTTESYTDSMACNEFIHEMIDKIFNQYVEKCLA